MQHRIHRSSATDIRAMRGIMVEKLRTNIGHPTHSSFPPPSPPLDDSDGDNAAREPENALCADLLRAALDEAGLRVRDALEVLDLEPEQQLVRLLVLVQILPSYIIVVMS
jgi:hypothetical protein